MLFYGFFLKTLSLQYIIISYNLCYCYKTKEITQKFQEKRKNILFVVVDDLRHLLDDEVNLPNIKRLAGNGFNFKNAFAQQALCAPSRNSMLTGRRPDSLHLYDFYNYWRKTVGNFTTLPQLFKEHGYTTYSVGKIFHPGISSNFTDDYPLSWTVKPYHPPSQKYKNAAVCFDNTTKRLQRNLICPVDVNMQPQHSLPDLETLDHAVKILQKSNHQSKPFFLAVGFQKPHIPLKYPKQYLNMYPIEKVSPAKYPYIPKKMPLVAWHPWTDLRSRDDIARLNLTFPYGLMDKFWSKKIKQSYYAASTYVDDLIGELLQNIDMSNTIVVLTSDHGWSLGENGLWAKYSNFNVALKVPLIFHIPTLTRLTPKAIEAPVELIDIFPTLVDITGIKRDIPQCNKKNMDLCFDGKSLLPLMKNTVHRKFKNMALSQYPRPSEYPVKNSDKPHLKNIKIMGYSIKTNRFRYTEWIGFNNTHFIRNWNNVYGIELYDHFCDIYESKNLYKAPAFHKIITHLAKLLRDEVNKTYI